jgi:hypothetical protein
MGFRNTRSEEKRLQMLVLAEISGKTEDEIKEFAASGIAGCIVDGAGLTAATLSRYLKYTNGMAGGLALLGSKAANGFKLVSASIDFIVFDINLAVAAFEGRDIENAGKVLYVDTGIETDLLRSVHRIYPGIDAVMINLRVPSLTMENMMACRRVSDFSGQHIIAMVNKTSSDTELLALRDAGVKALVLPQDSSIDGVKAMMDAVSAMPKPERKKDNKTVALLPQLGMAPAPKEEEEGDDDGE